MLLALQSAAFGGPSDDDSAQHSLRILFIVKHLTSDSQQYVRLTFRSRERSISSYQMSSTHFFTHFCPPACLFIIQLTTLTHWKSGNSRSRVATQKKEKNRKSVVFFCYFFNGVGRRVFPAGMIVPYLNCGRPIRAVAWPQKKRRKIERAWCFSHHSEGLHAASRFLIDHLFCLTVLSYMGPCLNICVRVYPAPPYKRHYTW